MTIDVRQCRAFLSVADGGSLGRAADVAHVTQPALSRMLAEMERRLGHRLFERHPRGMTLTAAGQALLPYARLIAFEAREAERTLDDLGRLKWGNARIGAVGTIVRGLLPDVVSALLRSAPGLSVTIIEQPDDQLQRTLRNRDVDLIIGAAPPSAADVEEIGICRHDDLFVVVCSADHPLQDAPPDLDAVLCEKWVMPLEGWTPRLMFFAAVANAGRAAPSIAVETTSPDAMVNFIASSRLLGWLPRSLIASAVASGLVRELLIPELAVGRQFHVLRRAAAPLSPACQALFALLPLKARRALDAEDRP